MYGICIHGVRGPSHNNSIIGNTITNHSTGVDIRKSTGNNTISNNIITGYSEGIRIHTGGNWNIIHGNVIPNTNDCQYPSFRGIELFYIFDTNISSNYIETINGGILISNGNNNSISENTLLGIGDDGICIFDSYDSNISWNVITNFDRGIYLSDSYNFSIYMNNISNCNIPIYIVGGGQTQGNLLFINARSSDSQNIIKRNNFLHNKFPAIFIFRGVVLGIIWRENYWGRPRLLPKIIIGFKMFAEVLPIPARVQFDWHPAKKPYDIPRVAI